MNNDDSGLIIGHVVVEKRGPDGLVLARCVVRNLITDVGDQMYGERGAGIMTLAAPVGMRLGTGASTGGSVPAKNGAFSTLVAFLSGSSKALDATPGSVHTTGRAITYIVTYGPGVATTASTLTEAVLTNDAVAVVWASGGAGVQANTVSRVALTGIGAKGASDTLVCTWTHTMTGA